jgi:cell division protein FtsL
VSALAQPAGVDAHPARKRKRTRVRSRRRVDRGVLWITGLAVLLAGVVAVNVAVLQLNVRLDELGRERIQLRDDNARLKAELSSTAANARIEQRAKTELGLVQADPEATTYVDLGARP